MVDHNYLKENKKIIQKLKTIPTFKYFEDKDLQGMMEKSKMIKYEPGEVIIKEGQYDNWIYFVIYGKLGINKQDETIGFLKERGDIFGEMGIIDGSPKSATIVAIDETVCLAIDASYGERLREADRLAFNGVLYQVFARILASRLRITTEELVKARDEIDMLKAELRKVKRK